MKDGRSLRRRSRSFTKALRTCFQYARCPDYYRSVDALLRRDPLHRVTFEVDE